MAMTNKIPGSVESPATFGGVQLKVAILCGLIQALDGYDLSAIGLAVPSLIKAWLLPPSAFTQAFALSSVGIMVGAMLAGPVADRFGRESPQFQGGARPQSARDNPVSGLFGDGLAVCTLVSWAIFLINLRDMFLISYWLPTVLNAGGFSPADAAFAASAYSAGGVLITLILGPLIARFGAERVLALSLLFGAICIGVGASVPMARGLPMR